MGPFCHLPGRADATFHAVVLRRCLRPGNLDVHRLGHFISLLVAMTALDLWGNLLFIHINTMSVCYILITMNHKTETVEYEYVLIRLSMLIF